MDLMLLNFATKEFELCQPSALAYFAFGSGIYYFPTPEDVKEANEILLENWGEYQEECRKYGLDPREYKFGIIYGPMMTPLSKITNDVLWRYKDNASYWKNHQKQEENSQSDHAEDKTVRRESHVQERIKRKNRRG